MGYTTEFYGSLQFNRPVTEELKSFINNFSNVRHMKRDNEKIKQLFPDWKDKCYNGKLGMDGEYFVGGKGFAGQGEDNSILSYNYPSQTQPGLWCDLVINDNDELVWNGTEKFYYYTEWLEYLIKNFFKPEGYVLNGILHYQGESYDDFGDIVVIDNVISVKEGINVMDLSDISDNSLIEELVKRGYTVA